MIVIMQSYTQELHRIPVKEIHKIYKLSHHNFIGRII